jgi:2'-5' RNA ligase
MSDCEHSALFVPVPEAEPVVGEWRAVHDPKARTGVPAHITLVVPWLIPERLGREELDELDRVVGAWSAFEYLLDKVCWFGDRVLWLAPNPSEPFQELTEELARHFATPAWGGEFDEIVPHLTVGLSDYALGLALGEAADHLAGRLPVACAAREVIVMCGDGVHWRVRHRSPFGFSRRDREGPG